MAHNERQPQRRPPRPNRSPSVLHYLKHTSKHTSKHTDIGKEHTHIVANLVPIPRSAALRSSVLCMLCLLSGSLAVAVDRRHGPTSLLFALSVAAAERPISRCNEDSKAFQGNWNIYTFRIFQAFSLSLWASRLYTSSVLWKKHDPPCLDQSSFFISRWLQVPEEPHTLPIARHEDARGLDDLWRCTARVSVSVFAQVPRHPARGFPGALGPG